MSSALAGAGPGLVAAVLTAVLLCGCAVDDGSADTQTDAPTDAPTDTPLQTGPRASTAAPEAVPDQAAPYQAPPVPDLPVCTYDDLPTRFSDPEHWATTLLDTAVMLSPDYHPDDLVPVGAAGGEGWGEVRALEIGRASCRERVF